MGLTSDADLMVNTVLLPITETAILYNIHGKNLTYIAMTILEKHGYNTVTAIAEVAGSMELVRKS